jgi:hypothetical protein
MWIYLEDKTFEELVEMDNSLSVEVKNFIIFEKKSHVKGYDKSKNVQYRKKYFKKD